MPGRFTTVLLDAGGVLLDLDYGYLRRLLEPHGCVVSEQALSEAEAIARTEIDRAVRGGGRSSEAWRDYFRVVLRRVEASPEDYEGIIDALWDAHQRFGLWTVPIDGATATVRRLKQDGFRLGVVSNAEGRVERDLDSAGFQGLFATVVDSSLVGVEKPDPAIFRIAMERMGADPASTLYVGDVPSVDIVGATAAGIVPVLLDRHDLYPGATAERVRSIGELPGWIERMSASRR